MGTRVFRELNAKNGNHRTAQIESIGIGCEWNNVINSGIKSLLKLQNDYFHGVATVHNRTLLHLTAFRCERSIVLSVPKSRVLPVFNAMQFNALLLYFNCSVIAGATGVRFGLLFEHLHMVRSVTHVNCIYYKWTTAKKNLIIIIITIKFYHCLQLQPIIIHVTCSKLQITYNLYYCCHSLLYCPQ